MENLPPFPFISPLTYSVWPPLLIFHWLIQCDECLGSVWGLMPWHPTSIRQCSCLIIFKLPLYSTASLPCTVCGWLIKHSQFNPLQDLVILERAGKISRTALFEVCRCRQFILLLSWRVWVEIFLVSLARHPQFSPMVSVLFLSKVVWNFTKQGLNAHSYVNMYQEGACSANSY